MTKQHIEDLVKHWNKMAAIEDDCGAVYSKHEKFDQATTHFEIARTWRQARAELEMAFKESQNNNI